MRKLVTNLLLTTGLVASSVPALAGTASAIEAGCGGDSAIYSNSSPYQIRFNGFYGCTNGDLYLQPGRTSSANPNFDGEFVYTSPCWAIEVRVSHPKPDGSGQWYPIGWRKLTWANSGYDGWHELADGWEMYEFTNVVPNPC